MNLPVSVAPPARGYVQRPVLEHLSPDLAPEHAAAQARARAHFRAWRHPQAPATTASEEASA